MKFMSEATSSGNHTLMPFAKLKKILWRSRTEKMLALIINLTQLRAI